MSLLSSTQGADGFNPHPTSQPDATPQIEDDGILLLVSTLIRPHSRMRQSEVTAIDRHLNSFNPHPTSQPDATLRRTIRTLYQ